MKPVPSRPSDGLLLLALLVCALGSVLLLAAPLTLFRLRLPRQVRLAAPALAGKTAVYIDCQPEGIVLYPGQQRIPLAALRGDQSLFQTFLKTLNPQKTYVLLAVRPQGISAFQTVRAEVRRRGLSFGYEPLDPDWLIRP
ncbi:MAG: hypothetical protein ACK5CA_02140 [Cyanobacteriota bacterium]|jgi:hypothetical protein